MATTQQPAPRQALIYKQAFYFPNKSYSWEKKNLEIFRALK